MPDSQIKIAVVLGSDSGPSRIPAIWLQKANPSRQVIYPLALHEVNKAVSLCGDAGVIHMDSARELANQRDETFEKLSEWVRLFSRHALWLPDSLTDLSPETQDQLGKDLAVLASCREEDFLLIGGECLDKSCLMASIRLWAAPKVQIKITPAPLKGSKGTHQEVFEILWEWVTRKI